MAALDAHSTLKGRTPIFINTVELVNDISDDKKFSKSVTAGLIQVRNAIGNGLFTAYKDETGWATSRTNLLVILPLVACR